MRPEYDIRPGIQALPASAIVTVANHGRGREGLIPIGAKVRI